MGSSQSTRKITVPNENAHIIKVSDSVIERLKNADHSSTNNAIVSSAQPPVSIKSTIPAASSYGGTLTSLQVLQEKEKQLKDNDLYWAKRVRALEDAQRINTGLMEHEFAKTVSAIENKLPKIPSRLSEAPCSDKKAKVLECYRSNSKQILLCSKEVAEFADCVDLKRLATA